MNDDDDNLTFLKRVDQRCARMNSGLSAVALVLSVMVLFMGLVRAAEIATAFTATSGAVSLSTDKPTTHFWTYD